MEKCIFVTFTWFIALTSEVKAETRIEVTESACGGNYSLDDAGPLHLDYYGAFLGKGKFVNRLLTLNKKCIFNIYSTNITDRQICVSSRTDSYYNSIACGIYFRYYLGSRSSQIYTCEDMPRRSPLCTELGVVIAEIEYNDGVVNNQTFLQLEIYSQPYQESIKVTTTDWRAAWVSKTREEIWGKEEPAGNGKSFLEKRWWIFVILGIAFLFGVAFGIWRAFAERHIQAVRTRQNQNASLMSEHEHAPTRQATSVQNDQNLPMLDRS